MADDKKKVEKVISGTAKRHQQSTASKLAGAFVEEDLNTVTGAVVSDVIIPGVKEILANAFTDTVYMILFGDPAGRGRTIKNSNSGAYHSAFNNRSLNKKRSSHERRRLNYNYDEVVVSSRTEAIDILENLGELIEMYGVVSVMDLYDLSGIDTNYTDGNWGWDNIENANWVRRGRDEYVIKMPKPVPIN